MTGIAFHNSWPGAVLGVHRWACDAEPRTARSPVQERVGEQDCVHGSPRRRAALRDCGVACAAASAAYALIRPMPCYACQYTALHVSDFLRGIWRPFAAGLGAGVAALVAQLVVASDDVQ